jgi:hypothetical protein
MDYHSLAKTVGASYVFRNSRETTLETASAELYHCPRTQRKINAHCAQFSTSLIVKDVLKLLMIMLIYF